MGFEHHDNKARAWGKMEHWEETQWNSLDIRVTEMGDGNIGRMGQRAVY